MENEETIKMRMKDDEQWMNIRNLFIQYLKHTILNKNIRFVSAYQIWRGMQMSMRS